MSDYKKLVKIISKQLASDRANMKRRERLLMVLVNHDPTWTDRDLESDEKADDPGPADLFHHLLQITRDQSDVIYIEDLLPFFKAFGYEKSKAGLYKWLEYFTDDIEGVRTLISYNRFCLRGVKLARPVTNHFGGDNSPLSSTASTPC